MEKCSFTPLSIPDVIQAIPRRFGDHRGYFFESYALELFQRGGVDAIFIQDNQSLSAAVGTIRGLHFQAPPSAQAKLVRVLAGAVFDVAVDIRRKSPTYGKWCAATLTAEGGEQLYIPHGFAHGFCTLEPGTVVAYKVDRYYDPATDAGILWDSLTLGIEWPLGSAEPTLSGKDVTLPAFDKLESPF